MTAYKPFFTPIVACLFLLPTMATHAKDIKTDEDKISYAIGIQIGQNLKRDDMKVDAEIIGMGIKDMLDGKDPVISLEELQKVWVAFQQKQQEERSKLADNAKQIGEKFLAENKKKKGVTELKSGIQYKVLTAGKGNKPSATDTVKVHYAGTLVNGTEFDSSYARKEPVTFPLNGVIKGWQEILPLMPTGAKWQVAIPSDLAYGARGAPPNIGPNETLLFDIELLEINPK